MHAEHEALDFNAGCVLNSAAAFLQKGGHDIQNILIIRSGKIRPALRHILNNPFEMGDSFSISDFLARVLDWPRKLAG